MLKPFQILVLVKNKIYIIKEVLFYEVIIKKVDSKKDIKNIKSKIINESLQEGETIINELKNGDRKGYTNMNDLIKSLNDN